MNKLTPAEDFSVKQLPYKMVAKWPGIVSMRTRVRFHAKDNGYLGIYLFTARILYYYRSELPALGRLLNDVRIITWVLYFPQRLEITMDCVFNVDSKRIFNQLVHVQ